MNEKYISKIDYLLESVRAHMNLFIASLTSKRQLSSRPEIKMDPEELKAFEESMDATASEQLSRLERDIKVIRDTFDEGLKEAQGMGKEEKK